MTSKVARKKKAGRPRKGEEPAFPAAELDRLLVYGERVDLDNGEVSISYPTYRELASRYGCAMSVIAEYAKSHNVLNRRQVAEDKLRERADEKLMELRAGAVAVEKDDEIRIIDAYIGQFEKALMEGRVRCDNVNDLNTALRLKRFLLGEADSRSEVHVTVSLEMLQARHKESARRVEVLDPAETGEVGRTPVLPADAATDGSLAGLLRDGTDTTSSSRAAPQEGTTSKSTGEAPARIDDDDQLEPAGDAPPLPA